MSQTLQRLMEGTWLSPETGERVMVPIQAIAIDSGVLSHVPELLSAMELGHKAVIVSDMNTYAVAGESLAHDLHQGLDIEEIVLSGDVKAEEVVAHDIIHALRGADFVIGVGSGTINDLCKYASFQERKPYIICGTAPSMNGYASSNATIYQQGYHQSVPAHLPEAIILDTDILAAAPQRLIRSGIGDSLCRSTAQIDWLLSRFLLDTPYTPVPYELLQEHEFILFEQAEACLEGDKNAIGHLAHLLVLSGLGMTLAGGSYPASQGEHMVAHAMGMLYGESLPHTYHGEQIGVTTLTMAMLQERLLHQVPLVPSTAFKRQSYQSTYGDQESLVLSHFTTKDITEEKAVILNQKLERGWQQFVASVRPFQKSYATIKDILRRINAPISPDDLGWDQERYAHALNLAPLSRDRFTFLDLVSGVAE